MKESPPIIKVKQRVMAKRTNYQCEFFDGFAEVTYENEKVATETFKRMKAAKMPVKQNGNTIFDYFKKKNAWQIYELYLKDIKKAMTQNGVMMKVNYELV